jgi:hypothetical protein
MVGKFKIIAMQEINPEVWLVSVLFPLPRSYFIH